MTLGELVAKLGGKLTRGAAETTVTGVSAAGRASQSDLLFAEDTEAAKRALACEAAAFVVKPGCVTDDAGASSVAVIEAEQPRLWFARAAKLLKTSSTPTGVHPSAVIGTDVRSSDLY